MTKGIAVIGANFGDEGKGLMTDYFVAEAEKNNESVIVCRFNGGSQAGHTVETPDGIRHVFSHFGSGTLQGAPTYLSRHFIVNPMTFTKEFEALERLGLNPSVYIHPTAYVTTPFDMLTNRAVEVSRGEARHGSVGLGINETVTRCVKSPEFRTTMSDLMTKSLTEFKASIENLVPYFKDRMLELGIPVDSIDPLINDWHESLEAYIENVLFLKTHSLLSKNEYLLHYDTVIFEGAQGLLLDEDHYFFPYVTRSKTGCTNVVEISNDINLESLELVYVTRTYMTRHGAGPFPSEDPTMEFEDITNKANDWQQSIRFGYLDMDLLEDTIWADLENSIVLDTDTELRISAAVTWFDPKATRRIMHGGLYQEVVDQAILDIVNDIVDSEFGYARYAARGKTRNDVKPFLYNLSSS